MYDTPSPCSGPRLLDIDRHWHQVHAIQGINTWDLEIKPSDAPMDILLLTRKLTRSRFDGRTILDEFTYEPPAHRGELPKAEVEGGKIHSGSCHCGKVTVAVKSKPIDETFDESPFVVCNCSICERVSRAVVPNFLFFHFSLRLTYSILGGLHLDLPIQRPSRFGRR